ncbi:unnamed protein product [Rotaria magnacalcarata]|uniref:Uncharacterized protein n=2 Tax=Rotaria magnacalcarata TaxID=392030 RepID=A0A815ZUF0_9BILA|nr:unnamed protein product [Rotaria magnacalcarata]CAF2145710.1 unnamed protein product [Rotaria magnacalcarata]
MVLALNVINVFPNSKARFNQVIYKNIVFEQAKEIAKELLIEPTAPRTYQRRYGQDILDPEEFYRDQVFLPLLRELKVNIEKRLSIFNQIRIQILTRLRPEHITSTSCSITELYKKLTDNFFDRLLQPLLMDERFTYQVRSYSLSKYTLFTCVSCYSSSYY